jgi:hypothetical protein
VGNRIRYQDKNLLMWSRALWRGPYVSNKLFIQIEKYRNVKKEEVYCVSYTWDDGYKSPEEYF